MGIEYLVHTDVLLRIFVDMPFPFLLGHVEETIVYQIGNHEDLVILLIISIVSNISSSVSNSALTSKFLSLSYLWPVIFSNFHILYPSLFQELKILMRSV